MTHANDRRAPNFSVSNGNRTIWSVAFRRVAIPCALVRHGNSWMATPTGHCAQPRQSGAAVLRNARQSGQLPSPRQHAMNNHDFETVDEVKRVTS